MAVSNGQLANQTTFNNAFVSKTVDSTTVGKITLANTDVVSGSTVSNTQRELNSINSYTGHPVNTAEGATPVWTSNESGTSNDSLKERAEAQDEKFNNSTGHAHSGAVGDGSPIQAENLQNINLFYGVKLAQVITVSGGTSNDVSSDFSGDTPGGDDATLGVVTTAPRNTVDILNSDGDFIEDVSGNRVYGRLTESSGTWTLTYYVNDAGTETPIAISADDLTIFYKEVFDQADRPTFSDDIPITSDPTADVVDASVTQRGLVSTGVQSFAGDKTFTGTITASNLTGTNTGDVTLGAIGATPNANGSSLSGQVLNLQPADSTFGGVLTAISQVIAGLKTFAAGVIAQTTFRTEGVVETSIESNGTATGSNATLTTPTKEIVYLSNSSLVSIEGITAPSQAQKVTLLNRTTNPVTILETTGTPANAIVTGTGADITLDVDSAITLFYDTNDLTWQIQGGTGSGSGGGAIVVDGTQNISASGTITAAVDQRELRRIQGNSAAVIADTTTPITAGSTEGQELILKGMSDTDTVTIEASGNVQLNGDMIFYNNSTLSLVWIDSKWLELARKI